MCFSKPLGRSAATSAGAARCCAARPAGDCHRLMSLSRSRGRTSLLLAAAVERALDAFVLTSGEREWRVGGNAAVAAYDAAAKAGAA